jgi:hypothetical protein
LYRRLCQSRGIKTVAGKGCVSGEVKQPLLQDAITVERPKQLVEKAVSIEA